MCFRFSYFKLKFELMRVRVGLSIDISILLGYVEVSEIFGKYSEIFLIEAWVYLPFFIDNTQFYARNNQVQRFPT